VSIVSRSNAHNSISSAITGINVSSIVSCHHLTTSGPFGLIASPSLSSIFEVGDP
jgi:hypothetical protein